MDHVELFTLSGGLEVIQSLPHQVFNAKDTNLSLLHHVVGKFELGALLYDERPPFCE
jgi:hypothetical protein